MRLNLQRRSVPILLALAVGGAGLGLLGAGVSASFTDGGTAQESVSVGTFGITVSSSQGTCSDTGGKNMWTCTYTAPTILSSAAGSAPYSFKVTGAGSIPAVVRVTSNGGSPAFASPWSDLFTAPAAQTLANGVSYTYSGGIAWSTLSDANLGQMQSVTYTIAATES